VRRGTCVGTWKAILLIGSYRTICFSYNPISKMAFQVPTQVPRRTTSYSNPQHLQCAYGRLKWCASERSGRIGPIVQCRHHAVPARGRECSRRPTRRRWNRTGQLRRWTARLSSTRAGSGRSRSHSVEKHLQCAYGRLKWCASERSGRIGPIVQSTKMEPNWTA
jgi:hypothetical protein